MGVTGEENDRQVFTMTGELPDLSYAAATLLLWRGCAWQYQSLGGEPSNEATTILMDAVIGRIKDE
jgi:hypothetical protein